MAKREDIKKVLIIGSGPIVIGQACEFDYSGTQACRALRDMGYEVVLVNSNPATIMTDPQMANSTYIEPLNKQKLTEIIEKERPCALLPNFGGQTALNLSVKLSNEGILSKFGVEVVGVNLEAIERGEDRVLFKKAMAELNIEMPLSEPAHSVTEAVAIGNRLGYPCVVRPAFTMGGTGGGIADNEQELREIAERGINASGDASQILVEESVLGWEELELEIVRDHTGKCITICFIENIDPMGVHTGDSICCAPMLNVTQDVMKRLQDYAYAIVGSIGVLGGCNCQFAYNPKDGRIVVIEINPRTSRSSALASKATGFPIARISAQLAMGYSLAELPYYRGQSLAEYEPWGDYVVIKFPRWAFEKFPEEPDELGTQMKAVGETMSIGKNYKEALQKAVRSLENGRQGLGKVRKLEALTLEELLAKLHKPGSERFFIIYEAFKKGASVEQIFELTKIKPFFLNPMLELAKLEQEIEGQAPTISDDTLEQAKRDGFSDAYLAKLLNIDEKEVRESRYALGVKQRFAQIQVSGADDKFYYYSTYAQGGGDDSAPVAPSGDKKVLILGGGPNRIGQGIEFDYCCVHAAYALRDMGHETIMVNCNPETVSTDYDTADRLYFEPLTVEDVYAIVENEGGVGGVKGVVVQFGGQTPLNIASQLEGLGVNILGTSPSAIADAEDRKYFRGIMEDMGVPMPPGDTVEAEPHALLTAKKFGFPLIVRPSYVLGGAGMEIVYDIDSLKEYVNKALSISNKPVLIDRFLEHAIECEVDALSDGEEVFIPAVLEHIERTGVHSGDSACLLPSVSITEAQKKTIENYTKDIAKKLNVKGLINIQFAIDGNNVYVLEANPRASRTLPLISKICNIQMALLATQVMTGKRVKDLNPRKPEKFNIFGVKEAVFPFNKFPSVNPNIGPEMRSTGEVLGINPQPDVAYALSQQAAGTNLPSGGKVLVSVAEAYFKDLLSLALMLRRLGFEIYATTDTQNYLEFIGEDSAHIQNLEMVGNSKDTHAYDLIMHGEFGMIVNTVGSTPIKELPGDIRRAAYSKNIPIFTTVEEAVMACRGIDAMSNKENKVRSLQDYHKGIMYE